MPLFFFISGYLFKRLDWKTQIKKIIRGLYIPYLFLGGVFYMLLVVPGQLRNSFPMSIEKYMSIFVYTPLLDIVDGAGWGGNGPLWFLTSLITVMALFRMIPEKYLKNNIYFIMVFLLLSPLLNCIWFNLLTPIGYRPWAYPRILIIFVYFCLGYLLKRENIFIHRWLKSLFVVFFLLMILISPKFSWETEAGGYATLFLSYQTFILSMLGIFMIMLLSIWLSNKWGYHRYVEFISMNTLTLFGLECFWEEIIRRLMWHISSLNTVDHMPPFYLTVCFKLLFGCLSAYLLTKYMPQFIGKRK